MSSRHDTRAFSLVEMLLVVALIALLISILLPSLRSARESARRTLCAANLGQWGTAILTYATDNNGKILRTPRPHGNRPHPMIAWGRHDISAPAKGGVPTSEFAASLINPYISGVDLVGKTVPRGSIWICPSSVGNGMVPEAFINAAPLKVWDGLGYFHYSYQYFAAVGPEATHPDELPGMRIKSGSQTLMTDEIWKQIGFNAWQYGHGSPPSNHRTVAGVSVSVLSMPSSLEGINKLLGDGSVSWKGAAEFDLSMMGAAPGVLTAKNHWVNNSVVSVPY